MSRQKGNKEYRTFVKGIITEANALTFPENASLDESNFVLQRDGSRQRRLGLDYENDYILSAAINEDNFNEGAITTHNWNNILGNSASSLVVVQVGDTLHFYDNTVSAISANKLSYTIDLNEYAIDGASLIHKYPIQAAAIRGYFVVVGKYLEPFYVIYEKDSDTFFSAQIQPRMRDIFGLDDGFLIDEEPSTLTDEHQYNLYNQGWTADKVAAYKSGSSPSRYPSNVQIWTEGRDASDNFSASLLQKQHFGNTPAPRGHYIQSVFNPIYEASLTSTDTVAVASWHYNASTDEVEITTSSAHGMSAGDIFSIGGLFGNGNLWKLSALLYQGLKTKDRVVSTILSSTQFAFTNHGMGDPTVVNGFTNYGRIYYVRDSGSTPILEKQEDTRFTTCAGFAGRAWYAGLTNSIKSNYIFFSQILDNEDQLSMCYQQADPTAQDISDIVDTDGGFIIIPELNRVTKLVPVRESLLVFAENGVWQINGDPDKGFTATTYSVVKISSVGTEYVDTIVQVEGAVVYWSIGGIYAITPDQTTNLLNAHNLSEQTIQTLYLEIAGIAKAYATGTYDKTTKRISWLYNDDSNYLGYRYVNKYNKELVYDTVLQAFYKNEIGELASNSPYIAGYITTNDIQTTNQTVSVVASGVVVEASGVLVQDTFETLGRGLYSNKFLTVVPDSGGATSQITFAAYISPTFYDWVTADGTGISYSSYLYTGYEIYGDTQRDKAVKYLTTHFKRTETGFVDDGSGGYNAENPSGCYMQAQWGWSNHVDSGRWSTAQQVYRLNRLYLTTGVSDPFNYGFSVITTKNKIRGHGKSLSLYFYSEAGKDCHILGWGTDVNMETSA